MSNKRNPWWNGDPEKHDAAILRRKIKLSKRNGGGRKETRALRAEAADARGYATGRNGRQPWTCDRR